MKVLWITNTLFPTVCKKLQIPTPVVGGWMHSSAESLIRAGKSIELGVASTYHGKTLQSFEADGVVYFLIPQQSGKHQYAPQLESYWKEVRDTFCPDVVHIHGTEYPHGLAYVNGCGNKNVVVSIQGLVSIYERYYYGGISEKELLKNVTLRDRIRRDSIFRQRKKMQKRGFFEKLLIEKVDHIIGRTLWDKVHTWAINPHAGYHFCNETLRGEFYGHTWQQDHCEKHSIFLSQAHYPIKGLQQMIKALPLILREYPDTKVYVAGNSFINTAKKWKVNGFGKYIHSLMNTVGVADRVVFTGLLSEKEMCKRYLGSNVFVCPSSIENSPNSVGEAQLLGVPCVASYVGGVPDMVTNEETGLLYRFDEAEMLAMAVCRIFKDTELAQAVAQKGKEIALARHSQIRNAENLNSIYDKIYAKNSNYSV